MKAAEAKRLEEERLARARVLEEEQRRAQESRNAGEVARLGEELRREREAGVAELHKALEEARLAREAAKAAEEQRIAAITAADTARSEAEAAIAKQTVVDRAKAGLRPPPYSSGAGTLFTEEHAARVRALANKHGLRLPDYQFDLPADDVPAQLRRFIGVWMDDIGARAWRRLILIVTKVGMDGSADGWWLYGPPTATSFGQGPASLFKVAGRITGDTLRFSDPAGKENYKLTLLPDGRLNFFYSNQKGQTNQRDFRAVWTLVDAERSAKR
jgi:hypothetical protein